MIRIALAIPVAVVGCALLTASIFTTNTDAALILFLTGLGCGAACLSLLRRGLSCP